MRAGISSVSSSIRSSAIASARLGEMAARPHPRLGTAAGQRAHPADIGGALGHAYHAARVEEVEGVARLDALVVGRKDRQSVVGGQSGSGGVDLGGSRILKK